MKVSCLIASLRLGGAERQLAGLAVMLKEHGYDVEVITYRSGDFYSAALEEAGVPRVRISPSGGSIPTVRRLVSHLKGRGTEVLVSFLAGTNIKACMAAMAVPGLRLIVSERNCNRSMLPHDAFRFALYRRAESVVCNSYAQDAFIRRHFRSLGSRLAVIPNFADLKRFRPQVKAPGSPLGVVITARLDRRKNALGLIRAAAAASRSDLRFDWYGSCKDDAYKKKCLGLIRSLGLQERFSIHGAADDVERIYHGADFFCLPSFYEGTPNALAEALACGLPALVSDVSDNARYVRPGVNGFLFDPTRTASITAALRAAAEMTSAEREAAGKRSRMTACESFQEELFFERYVSLLEGGKAPA